jgi:ABC-2 type transport system permease protein
MTDSPAKPPRRYHPLLGLTLARVREFLREPEAVFWTYVFPLVLVVALGVAFRDRPVSTFRIAVRDGDLAEPVAAVLNGDPRFQASVWGEEEGRLRLRTGRADAMVAVLGQSPARYEYYYDPTRTESVLARNAADDFLQRAAGRRDPAEVRDQLVDEPGGRYIDFLVPGLLGMGLMGGACGAWASGSWTCGFASS